jgi:hypothetical protein
MKNFPPSYLSFASLLCLLTACGGNTASDTSSSPMQAPPLAAAPADDTVTFLEPRKNYTLLHSPSSISVTHNITKVTTTHLNAKHIQFSDVSVNLMVAQNAKTISGKDLNSLIDLYVAFFNRVPDADGLNYWIDTFKAGATLEQIGANFYLVAKQYPDITGYDAKMNDEAFVRLIYKNVLGRVGSTAPPDSHVDYWVKDLQKGLSKEKLVAVMLVAAREYAGDKEWGWMTSLLNNKVALGKYFALEQGLTYRTYEDSIRNTVALTAAVTPTDYIKAKNLVGVRDREFNLQTSSSSGVGRMIDCYNPALYAVGNTVRYEQLQTKINWGIDDTFTIGLSTFINDYKVTGPVNFKGNSVLALIGTKTNKWAGSPDSIWSTTDYVGVANNELVFYGSVSDEIISSSNQRKFTLNYSLPAERLPFSLAINENFTQSFTEYQEDALTNAPIGQKQSTSGIVFLGIEEITVPAGSFPACKIKYSAPNYNKDQPDNTSYAWYVASGSYRGMLAKILDSERWIIETTKFQINGK